MSYRAQRLQGATNVVALERAVSEEFERVERALGDMVAIDLRPIHAEPVRPRDGMIVFADGTDWNPGSGRGLYVYNGGWVVL